jgi:putative ABC transport system permease protein
MATLIQDLRYGIRLLAKSPGFTIVAIITLALGIGANTAMFSVVYGVLLRPLPYPHPERIVQISATYRGQLQPFGFTANAFDSWKQHSQPFQYLAASTSDGFNLAGAGRPERIAALRVSSEYFRVFGVQPFFGRSFNAQEEQIGGPNVAILSYGLWKDHFAGDRHAVGRTILLNGLPYTVIGVMPASFMSILPASPLQTFPIKLWTTIGQVRNGAGSGQNYDLLGRLKGSFSRRSANAYLAGVSHPMAEQFYKYWSEPVRRAITFVAVPYSNVISSDVRTPLLVLFGAIGFVLLIACVNVANLLLARTASRNREIALRIALGASGGRIVRQLLTESVLLAVLSGTLGLLVAFWGTHTLLALAPNLLPRAEHIGINGWALVFTAGVAVLTGILFGLAPAFQASCASLNESLKEAESHASFGRRRRWLSDAMVSAEVALSLILLIGSGLLIATFTNLVHTNSGFDPHGMLAVPVWTAGSKYNSMPKLSNFYEHLVSRLESVPGVTSAGVVAGGLPLETGLNLNPGVRVRNEIEHPSVDFREVTPGYYTTLRDRIIAGRAFTPADSSNSAKVTIINAAFAHQFFPKENPIGRHLYDGRPMEIVGVAADVRSSLNEPAPATYFVPIAQADFATDQGVQGWFSVNILVRTAVVPLTLSHAVETAVRDAAPDIPIGHIQSMEQALAVSVAFNRFLMILMSVFAGIALLLAAIGIYGVLGYWVRQRTREIGIRMALGAQHREVLRLVMTQGLRMALIGVAAGVIAALLLARLMSRQLYGISATDPLTFSVVAVVLVVISLAATYIPARRATKLDPMVALRYE